MLYSTYILQSFVEQLDRYVTRALVNVPFDFSELTPHPSPLLLLADESVSHREVDRHELRRDFQASTSEHNFYLCTLCFHYSLQKRNFFFPPGFTPALCCGFHPELCFCFSAP